MTATTTDPGRARFTLPKAGQANSLVASAAILTASQKALTPALSWQDELWDFYDNTPELRFGIGWLSNAMSRVRLYAGRWADGADEPLAVDLERGTAEEGETRPAPTTIERAAVDLMAQLCEGPTGQSQMLSEFATHLSLPGVGFLVGIPRPELPRDEWVVLSQDEIGTKASPASDDGYVWTRKTGDDKTEELPPGTLVVKVWRPHKRRKWLNDSPARAQLPVLRELGLLTEHVKASATSRLAGAGIILLPTEVQFPVSDRFKDADDPFLMEFIEVTTAPIKDRASASAVVPFPLRMPGEFIDKVRHLSFATPLDDKAILLREEAIRRFATGMDLPAEVVLGLGDSNHWTAWQVEESALKLHVNPAAETICQGLTIGYLRSGLLALGFPEAEVSEFVVWYDASELKAQPDRSADAITLYGLGVIGAKALRTHTGFGDDDAPTPEEVRTKMLLDVVTAAPSLFPVIGPLLGIEFPGLPAEPIDAGTPAPATPATDTPAGQGPPDTAGDPPPDVGQAALLAASDQIVRRALERAGNRLLTAYRRKPASRTAAAGTGIEPQELGDTPVVAVHTVLPDPTGIVALDALLAGAWTDAEDVAVRWEVEPAALTAALDGYTRGLIAGQQPHTWENLVRCMGGELVA